MTALALIAESARLGIVLTPKGGNLHCRPRDRITADLRARLKANKADVLDTLDERERWPGGVPGWLDGVMEGRTVKADTPAELPPELRSYAEPGDVGSLGYRTQLARIRRRAAAKQTP